MYHDVSIKDTDIEAKEHSTRWDTTKNGDGDCIVRKLKSEWATGGSSVWQLITELMERLKNSTTSILFFILCSPSVMAITTSEGERCGRQKSFTQDKKQNEKEQAALKEKEK